MPEVTRVCVLQFERAGNFKRNIQQIRSILKEIPDLDFTLLGGEFSLNESIKIDPYPILSDLAIELNCNLVAPINANQRRFPGKVEMGVASMHVFARNGEAVAIQDKHHLYKKEREYFAPGGGVKSFIIEDTRIGLVRGLDILYPSYTQALRKADIIFFSTLAGDDMMLNLAKTRALENQCYIAMSSYIGSYMGMECTGNAAIMLPNLSHGEDMIGLTDTRLFKHTREEGALVADIYVDYIRKLKREHPLDED